MHKYGRRCGVLAAAALALGAAAAPAGAARPSRTSVPGSVPRWAQPSRDRGDAASSKPVTVTVYLPLRDAAAADALAQQVSDPASASYGQFLTPDAIRPALRRQRRGRRRRVELPARRRPERRRRAGQQRLRRGDAARSRRPRPPLPPTSTATPTGAGARRPQHALSVPSSLDGKVLAVTGLDQSGVLHPPAERPARARRPRPRRACGPAPAAARRRPTRSSTRRRARRTSARRPRRQYPAVNGKKVPFAPCGYTPSQFQGAYGTAGLVAKGIDGRGVTVAITDAYAAPTILPGRQHVRASATASEPSRAGQFKQILPKQPFRYGFDDTVNGDLCGEQGWYGEETLDVEAVHAMAPGRQRPLRRPARSLRRPRPADGAQHDRRQAPRRHHHQLVGRHRRGPDARRPAGLQHDVRAGRPGGHRRLLLLRRRRRRQPRTPRTARRPSTSRRPHPLVTAVGGTSLAVDKNNGYQFETGWAHRHERPVGPTAPRGTRPSRATSSTAAAAA